MDLKAYSRDYLLGSDILFVVTDSTPRNVINSRELIKFATHFVDRECPIIAIANKQDLTKKNGIMSPERVEEILQIKTYGLTAINPSERNKLLDIMRKELNQVVLRRRLKEDEL
ncbi:MAG: hypothetical protein ACTSO6_01305 [Promethearchaeota archaeon]